ncbi:MAG: aminomethyl-transferring glycine dehydrogenase subunit GcvPB [candidate division Zixibacteria bacterium]|nr:aminomethyl-transferring glycine dehydrogenase subunit GcvPB [candidate division Zixibacteria bacterium]
MSQKLIFELSSKGRAGCDLPEIDLPVRNIKELVPEKSLRQNDLKLPEVSQVDVVRHFIALSILNHHVDKSFYPLGSCTMKYNPKVNEDLARLSGFSSIHPYQPEETVQGTLQLMYELGEYLKEIGGMNGITLQPAAGAQGELTGLLITRAYHTKNGNPRSKIIIPDSAHGTNPASVTITGYQVIQVKSNDKGLVDLEELKKVLDEEVACFMLTVPNTLGLFESQIEEISKAVHNAGAILYMDGANLNALLGIVRPGDMGFDIVHFNLHKTFSTPHGGGGPGAGPLGVKKSLEPFLPVPVIDKNVDEKGEETYSLNYKRPDSIGKLQGFYGNFGIMVRAYAFIRACGAEGLKKISENAVINANYIMESLKELYNLPYPGPCMHEFVLSGSNQKSKGVRTADMAKRILDYGLHAPTVYFPLIVSESLMIEPTESESRESCDQFIEVMKKIAQEVEENPELVKGAPYNTPVSRLDEVKATKDLNVRWKG